MNTPLIPKSQPPSGGCVLKPLRCDVVKKVNPATFGRLCVETGIGRLGIILSFPAAFGRLCVETRETVNTENRTVPAAFGRLCVETR